MMRLFSTSIVLASTIVGSTHAFGVVPTPVSTSSRQTQVLSVHRVSEEFPDSPSNNPVKKVMKSLQSTVVAASLLLGASFSLPIDVMPIVGVTPAHAESSKVVGALKGSGLVFKDTLQIERFEDPKVKGVVLYISNFDRPITEKLTGGNFFNDPSYASVACARTGGKVAIADNIQKGIQGEEVFEESRSLLFKTLRVQRVYDVEANTVVYVSYNTRLDKGDDSNKSRFKSSLCAINLSDLETNTPSSTSAAASAAKTPAPVLAP